MKFLQLREALDRALPPDPPKPPPPPELPTIPFYSPGEKRQTVVGGELLLTPVNQTARMVVAKAPWWAHPPDVETTVPKPLTPQRVTHTIKRKDRTMSISPNVVKQNHPAQPPSGVTSQDKDKTQFNAELATEAIKRTADSIDGIRKLVDQAMDARAALDIVTDQWKAEWMDFMDQGDERLRQLRMTRMAFEVEAKILVANLKDVRQFFLDKNHDVEVARLREFVDLCERLQKLKQSGFLDTVADTLIKLS